MTIDEFIDKHMIPGIFRNINTRITTDQTCDSWLSSNILHYVQQYNSMYKSSPQVCQCKFELLKVAKSMPVVNVLLNKSHTFTVDMSIDFVDEFVSIYFKNLLYAYIQSTSHNDDRFLDKTIVVLQSDNKLEMLNMLIDMYKCDKQLLDTVPNCGSLYYKKGGDVAISAYSTTVLDEMKLNYLVKLYDSTVDIATIQTIDESISFNLDFVNNRICEDIFNINNIQIESLADIIDDDSYYNTLFMMNMDTTTPSIVVLI